jgi:hypothetical protein
VFSLVAKGRREPQDHVAAALARAAHRLSIGRDRLTPPAFETGGVRYHIFADR